MAANPEDHGLEISVAPMERRHLKSVVRIEGDVYPRPWSMSLFLSELALSGSRAYFVALAGGQGPSGPRSGGQGPSGPRSGGQGPSGPRSGGQGPSGPRSGGQGPSGPRSGGQVVGYAGLMMSDDDGHVTTIAVDPDFQRQKVATRLMLVLAREAILRGATSLTLEVRVANKGAQAMYRRFGFLPVGLRRNYYQETNEDALVMWADDVNTPGYRRRLNAVEALVPPATLLLGDDPAPA